MYKKSAYSAKKLPIVYTTSNFLSFYIFEIPNYYALILYSKRILSAIKATNSELVGLPFPLLTV